MKRLTVWASADDADAVASRLLKLRCVDVDEAPANTDECLAKYDPSVAIRACEAELAEIESAMEPLYPYSRKSSGFSPAPPININREAFAADRGGMMSEARNVCQKINLMRDRLAAIEREMPEALAKAEAVKPWMGCGIALDCEGTEHTRLFLGSLPNAAADGDLMSERTGDLAAAWRVIYRDGSTSYCIFIVERNDADELLRRLNTVGFARAVFPRGCGCAEEISAAESDRACMLAEEKKNIEESFCGLAGQLDSLRVLWDTISTKLAGERVKERLLTTGSCVMLDGWIPQKQTERAVAVLESIGCAYEFCDPQPGDNVPVKLENNKFAACFEWVVGMYSLPAYGTFDPTFVMSFFYILFFSMMFADVGYGLLLVLGGFLAPRLLHMKPQKAQPFYMFGICGIGCMIMGVLFGGYFGDMPLAIARAVNPEAELPSTLAIVVDPVADPMTFLIIGLALGFVHLVAGQVIKFILVWKNESWVDAVCDYALFWVLYAGLGLLFLAPSVGKWVTISALAAIVLTGGRKEKNILMRIPKGFLALYGLVNFGSDVLSYSRILALALSGSVLAQVMNILGTMGSSPVAIAIGMLLCFLIGHLLNLALSALGSFVHTSRLQYIEFFGKFYEDGGRPFAPAVPSEKYSDLDV